MLDEHGLKKPIAIAEGAIVHGYGAFAGREYFTVKVDEVQDGAKLRRTRVAEIEIYFLNIGLL